ncbi:hypothetical protein C8J57DRAFT_532265 [Mycena rebaudengoi]|nr:hypothetical protein C8J57DRAFT_532265 [Mycena rebaudengoi]
MPRPNRLKLSASGGSIPIKNLRPGASPKRGISHEHPYIGYTKLIGGKIMNGTNKSRLVVQALRRRLLRRGMNSPRTPKPHFPSHPMARPQEAGWSPPATLPFFCRSCLRSPSPPYFQDHQTLLAAHLYRRPLLAPHPPPLASNVRRGDISSRTHPHPQ